MTFLSFLLQLTEEVTDKSTLAWCIFVILLAFVCVGCLTGCSHNEFSRLRQW